MKKIIALAACSLAVSAAMAQNAPKAPAKKLVSNAAKCAITGFIRDTRNKPVEGVKAFIYKPDSSIAASGYTDSKGNYETNSVAPGTYFVKLVYPSYKTIMVSGVVMKMGLTLVSFKTSPPAADSVVPYTDLVPKVEKKKPGAAPAQPKKK